jgi:hypothetical protein
MGLGAIPQAPRLNLGKFRGSRSCGLVGASDEEDSTSHEVSFKVSTRDLWSNREVRFFLLSFFQSKKRNKKCFFQIFRGFFSFHYVA